MKAEQYNITCYTLVSEAEGYREDGVVSGTALAEALIAMARQWRADRQVFSVAVIQAFGAVIRETEEVFAVGKPPINDEKGLPFSVDPAVQGAHREEE